MPTISEQLAAATAQRQGIAAQRDQYRSSVVSFLENASRNSQYGNQATRNRLSSWAAQIKGGGSAPTIAEIDAAKPKKVVGLNPEWAYFGTRDPAAVYSEAGGVTQGVSALNALRVQNKAAYQTYVASDAGLSALDTQIASLQAAYQAELAAAQATQPQPSDPPGSPTPEQLDANSFSQTQAQSNERSRLRSDRARSNFASPGFGVGLQIPLGS
jgi:hypothetical protein